jgi:hypothetical protein
MVAIDALAGLEVLGSVIGFICMLQEVSTISQMAGGGAKYQ